MIQVPRLLKASLMTAESSIKKSLNTMIAILLHLISINYIGTTLQDNDQINSNKTNTKLSLREKHARNHRITSYISLHLTESSGGLFVPRVYKITFRW